MIDLHDRELAVFSAARQLPARERAAFLDEHCAGDAALRQRIEELLKAGEEAGDFLEPRNGTLRPGAVSTEKPGDRIGRYKLLQQIGEGGCGIVYMAEQEEPVRRRVALKVIKLGMDTKEVIARFEAERQALALMDHPNIAKVLDAGATEAGRPYFVMELVNGIKITDYCDQNSLSMRERLDLFIQVCQAIQHAHQKGIIHRDIKPSNILVTLNDSVPVPKVIDFGIAKATHGKLTDQTFYTAFEQFIGTPAYMSPEQAGMSALDIDTRTDIYSLGVVLYELLTGQTPFNAKELLQAGLDEVRRVIRHEEPVQPSTKLSTMQAEALTTAATQRGSEPPKLIQSVRGDLDWIVMKALEKDRARRYETASGLAADVQRHLSNEPVLARPPGNLYRLQKLMQRNKLVFAAAGAIAAALAVATALSVWALIGEHRALLEAEKERRQAEANELKAQAEAAKSQQVAQFLEDMLNGVGPSVALGRDTAMLKEILGNTAKRVQTDLASQPEVEGELCYTLGEVYWELGDLENAESMHRTALAVRFKALGDKNPEVAQSMRRLAHVLWRQGHLDKAQNLALLGVTMQQELFGSTNLEVARSLEDYSAILNTQGNQGSATTILRQALAIKTNLLGHDNLEVADTIDDLAGLNFSRRYKLDEATALFHEALAIRQKLLGAGNPLVNVDSLMVKTSELDIQGKSGEEEAAFKELVAAQRKLFGNEHPRLAQSLNTLASVLRHEGKLSESESIRREALAMQRKLLGGESEEAAQTLSNLGDVLMDENKLSEAETAKRESLAIRRKVFGDNSKLTAGSLTDLGQVLEKEGKLEDARHLYLEAAGGSSLSAAAAQYGLGGMHLHGTGVQKNAAEAAKWYRKAAHMGHSRAQIELAVLYFQGRGVPADEVKAVELFRKVGDQNGSLAMKTLANCYCSAGRSAEGIAVLAKICHDHPDDTEASIRLAALQAWFGPEADYEATRHFLVRQAEGTDQDTMAMRAAKAASLRPSSDAPMLGEALTLAQRAVKNRKDQSWYELSVGMAEYRGGQYTNAEHTLAVAEQAAGTSPDCLGTARLFRVMSLFRQNRIEEARKLFRQAEAQMPPFPQDENRPLLDGHTAPHDVMICWLAYKEAWSLLNQPAATP